MEKKGVEAATLQKKKATINKAKVKRTIKNILCRPDPVFWPNVTEEQATMLEAVLSKHLVVLPEFNKIHWKILKVIPKDQRPKQPKIKKVDGLIFGITECTEAIKDNKCSAVIIESTVNPRILVQPLIEACISIQVPILCLNGLRKITSHKFGIPTSCLGIKSGFLQELTCKIEEIAKLHKPPLLTDNRNDSEAQKDIKNAQDKMEIDYSKEENSTTPTGFAYLYRTSKKTRVFNPSLDEPKAEKAFVGQDFIEFPNKPVLKPSDNKSYKSMIVKRIMNNKNRPKRK